jgi:peptidoglycan hydrolase CwlO-like protein
MVAETIIAIIVSFFILIVTCIALHILTLLKLSKMGDQLNEISAKLDAANEKVTKIAADVQHLHDLISGTGETPTAEEWQAVKDKAEALNASLQAVDDATPEP